MGVSRRRLIESDNGNKHATLIIHYSLYLICGRRNVNDDAGMLVVQHIGWRRILRHYHVPHSLRRNAQQFARYSSQTDPSHTRHESLLLLILAAQAHVRSLRYIIRLRFPIPHLASPPPTRTTHGSPSDTHGRTRRTVRRCTRCTCRRACSRRPPPSGGGLAAGWSWESSSLSAAPPPSARGSSASGSFRPAVSVPAGRTVRSCGWSRNDNARQESRW